MDKVILLKEIPIPKVNQYPFDKAENWARINCTKAQHMVDKKRALEIKREFPLRTADYCEKMTFGKWRLTGPLPGKPDKEAPLNVALEYLKPHISNWKEFKQKFIEQLKQSFEAICNSDYKPEMVKEVNNSINQLLTKFALKGFVIQLNFVLHPNKVELYYSQRLVEMMSRIYEHYTGKLLDMKMYPQPPRPNGPRQMEMHLELTIIGTPSR